MTPEKLIELCEKPVEIFGKVGVPEHIYLTFPRQTLPKGQSVRLLGSIGPLGKICIVHEKPEGFEVVAVFERKKIVACMRDILDDT